MFIPHAVDYPVIFAGLWAELWHLGLGVGLIVLLAAAAWFLPFGKKFFIVAAIGCAMALGGYMTGLKNASTRCAAQAIAVDNAVKKVVKSTTTKRGRAWKDPYDSKSN